VLTLVEPQSSGIGGGAFLMYYDGKKVQAFDGRETAPRRRPTSTCSRIPTARRCRAPPASSAAARSARRACCACWRWPTAARQAAVEDPVRAGHPLSENAVCKVSPRLNGLLAWDRTSARTRPRAPISTPDGKPWPVGHILKNPALARTLREIADGGADAFYKGRIARDIAAKVTPIRPIRAC
jgi:gamma-glutamyltranspeptidase/glutathione hydrolase